MDVWICGESDLDYLKIGIKLARINSKIGIEIARINWEKSIKMTYLGI